MDEGTAGVYHKMEKLKPHERNRPFEDMNAQMNGTETAKKKKTDMRKI